MRRGFMLPVVLAVGACGCDGHTGDAIDREGGAARALPDDVTETDDAAPDGDPGCPDAGPYDINPGDNTPSLFDLPLDTLCGLNNGYPGGGSESQTCAGTIEVEWSDGADTNLWWLFDARTGELEAVGGTPGSPAQCWGARPSFVYPSQCENAGAGGWWSTPGTPLCTGYVATMDAGANADAGDAADAGLLDAADAGDASAD